MNAGRGWALLLGMLVVCSFRKTSGHGFLQIPAGRGTIGYPSSINPDHMSNWCGGLQVQLAAGGKCGVCGDPWNGPRLHEVGGRYATGKITGRYKAGTTIPVKVQLTANHEGWFEFRLCPVTNSKVEVTQQCLNQNLLKFADGKTRRAIAKPERVIDMKLQLPAHISCARCVLQWKYHAGNSVHLCPDGTNSPKCGPQEEFYNCADIAISGSSSVPGPQPTPKATPKPTNSPVTKSSGKKCVAIGVWANQPDMFTWCEQNCPLGNCPSDKCAC